MTDTSTDPEPAVADTSFLYALFSAGDVFHEEARKLVGRGTPILVPPEIFAETIALIHYRQGFRAAAAAGEWLREQAGLRFPVGPEALREAAWHEFSKANGRLSYPDAVVVAWAKDRGAKTLAFDDGILDAT